MEDFKYNSMTKDGRATKLVYGVGINDADYLVKYKNSSGTYVNCYFYQIWKGMLERCYSEKRLDKQPSYVGCYVAEGWLTFSNFKSWMEGKDYEGKALDKDAIAYGNKVYSENFCIFVSQSINNLLSGNERGNGDLPYGVSYRKDSGRYRVRVSEDGIRRHVGYFTSVNSAERAYSIAKAGVIITASSSPEALADIRLHEALIRHSQVFTDRADELDKLINESS